MTSHLARIAALLALAAAPLARGASTQVGDVLVLEGHAGSISEPFDLQGKRLRFDRTAGTPASYTLSVSDQPLEATVGAAVLAMSADGFVERTIAGFPFFELQSGGDFTTVRVGANGWIGPKAGATPAPSFDPPGAFFGPHGHVTEFVFDGTARIAGLWTDLDPTAVGASVTHLSGGAGATAREIFTWALVPEGNNLNTFQIVLWTGSSAKGRIDIIYGAQVDAADSLVGITRAQQATIFNARTDMLDFFNAGTGGPTPLTVSTRGFTQTFHEGDSVQAGAWVEIAGVAQQVADEGIPDIHFTNTMYTNFPVTMDNGAFAYHTTLFNDTTGIGVDPLNGRALFDRTTIEGFEHMSSLGIYTPGGGKPYDPRERIQTNVKDSTLSVLAHEFGHRWLAYVQIDDDSNGAPFSNVLLGRSNAHWSFFLDSDAAADEGNDWLPLGGGSFVSRKLIDGYPPLDRYLMGLASGGDVPGFFHITGGTPSNSQNNTTAARIGATITGGTQANQTLAQVIAAEGARSPAFGVAPTSFRQLFVLLVMPGTLNSVPAADVSKIEDIRNEWVPYFRRQTGSVGTVNTAPSTKTGGPDLVVGSLVARDHVVAAGNTARVDFQIRNDGNASAGASKLKLWLSADASTATPGNDTKITTFTPNTLGALAAGATTSGTISATLPIVTQGTYSFLLEVDSDDEVSETAPGGESNNLFVEGSVVVTRLLANSNPTTQYCSDISPALYDHPAGDGVAVTTTLNVPAGLPAMSDFEVIVEAQHELPTDIRLELQHPDTTTMTFESNGGVAADEARWLFEKAWPTLKTPANASPFNGKSPTGLWTLRYLDATARGDGNFDRGQIDRFCLVFAGGIAADSDGDTIADNNDNCPAIANADQANADGDSAGNACDGCPADFAKLTPGTCGCGFAETDSDADGTPDCTDGCDNDPLKTTPGTCGCGTPETDSDGDGTPDCTDGCINDPGKTAPGTCGCGVADTDSDGDGTPNCNDGCINDPAKTAPGTCGCGTPETDSDGDGTPNCTDGCPGDAAKTAPGLCGCGFVDSVVDSDGDGTIDCIDACPNDAGKTAPGTCGCGVADTDTDGDGTPDCNDGCPADPAKIAAGGCGCGVADTDSDGDGTPDCADNCPNDPSKLSPGDCGCGVAETDSDGDGVKNCDDNCPTLANADQTDTDADGVGDACECVFGDIAPDGVGNGTTSLSDFLLARSKLLQRVATNARDTTCGDVSPGTFTCQPGAQTGHWCRTGDGNFTLGDGLKIRQLVLQIIEISCTACPTQVAQLDRRVAGDIVPAGAPDGAVGIGDVVVALRWSVGLDVPTADEQLRADVAPALQRGDVVEPTGNGRVDIADVVVMLRASVGLHRIEWPERSLDLHLELPLGSEGFQVSATGWPAWASATQVLSPACEAAAGDGFDVSGDRLALACGTESGATGVDVTLRYRGITPLDPSSLALDAIGASASGFEAPATISLR